MRSDRIEGLVKSEVARYRVNGPLPIRFEYSHRHRSITALMDTLDRDSGQRTQIADSGIQLSPHLEIDATDDEIKEAIRRAVYTIAKGLYRHELDEQFKCDGVRIVDAHAHDEDEDPASYPD